MVSRVNESPAREPNGLEPPEPPRAPIRPPPLPRWISTSRMRNAPSTNRIRFKGPGSHDHAMCASLLRNCGEYRTGIIRRRPPGGKRIYRNGQAVEIISLGVRAGSVSDGMANRRLLFRLGN